MSLPNLLKIGRLKIHAPNGAEVRRLLAAAARYLAEALAECIGQADHLYGAVEAWLRERHAKLLDEKPSSMQ